MASTFSRSGVIWRASRSVTSCMTRRYATNPPTPMPITSSASSTLVAAMMPSRTLVVCRSGIADLLCRPAALARVACELAQRAPSFIRRRSRLLNRSAHVGELAHEIVELRLDLTTHPPSAFRHVEPSPHAARHCSEQGGQQYTRSLVHVDLLQISKDASADYTRRAPRITCDQSNPVPRLSAPRQPTSTRKVSTRRRPMCRQTGCLWLRRPSA